MVRRAGELYDRPNQRARIRGGCVHAYEPDEPSGYIAWREWAETKSRTHRQTACPDCGLFVFWTRRTNPATAPSEEPAP